MSHRLRRGLAFAACCLAVAAVPPLLSRGDGSALGEKYALLVGVRNYDKNELRNLPYAEADMTALADVLKKAGYSRVVLMTQAHGADEARFLPTAANIRLTLKGFLARHDAGDTVLVAFAGHGVQFAGEDENYFCPMDAKLADKTTLVALTEVYKDLGNCNAGTRLLLADCCRNDPRSDQARAADSVKLESVTRPQKAAPPGGVAALFSCSVGEKAFEDAESKHGVFFHFVIEGLQGKADLDHEGKVNLDELVAYTRKRVPDFVKDAFGDDVQQTPELIGKTHGTVALVTLDGGGRPAPLDCTGEKGVSAAEVRKAQEAWAKYLGRKEEEEDEIAPGVKMKFVLVPPGKFLMGSPEGEKDRDKDEVLHEVEITKAYYMGVYPVTKGQFAAFVKDDGYSTEAEKANKKETWQKPYFAGGYDQTDNDPVVDVTWNDAIKFCQWLSGKEKKTYELPTEAEWEYSCRGGRPSSQPFGIGDGTSLSSREANFAGSLPYGGAEKGPYLGKTTPVGSYKANALGLYDMQGNVWQWCSDWSGDYPTGRVVDPTGPASGPYWVIRGGSWWRDAGYCRAAQRNGEGPGGLLSDLGFRLARVPSGLGK